LWILHLNFSNKKRLDFSTKPCGVVPFMVLSIALLPLTSGQHVPKWLYIIVEIAAMFYFDVGKIFDLPCGLTLWRLNLLVGLVKFQRIFFLMLIKQF